MAWLATGVRFPCIHKERCYGPRDGVIPFTHFYHRRGHPRRRHRVGCPRGEPPSPREWVVRASGSASPHLSSVPPPTAERAKAPPTPATRPTAPVVGSIPVPAPTSYCPLSRSPMAHRLKSVSRSLLLSMLTSPVTPAGEVRPGWDGDQVSLPLWHPQLSRPSPTITLELAIPHLLDDVGGIFLGAALPQGLVQHHGVQQHPIIETSRHQVHLQWQTSAHLRSHA